MVEQVESFKFLGVHITNKLTWFEGTTKHIPLQETEKIWHGSSKGSTAEPEYPDWLHHCLVWQLLGLRPQGTTANGPAHHWGQASCHPGPLYQAVSEEGIKNGQSLKPPVIDWSLCYYTASCTGAPSLGPKGFLTASTPKP